MRAIIVATFVLVSAVAHAQDARQVLAGSVTVFPVDYRGSKLSGYARDDLTEGIVSIMRETLKDNHIAVTSPGDVDRLRDQVGLRTGICGDCTKEAAQLGADFFVTISNSIVADDNGDGTHAETRITLARTSGVPAALSIVLRGETPFQVLGKFRQKAITFLQPVLDAYSHPASELPRQAADRR